MSALSLHIESTDSMIIEEFGLHESWSVDLLFLAKGSQILVMEHSSEFLPVVWTGSNVCGAWGPYLGP